MCQARSRMCASPRIIYYTVRVLILSSSFKIFVPKITILPLYYAPPQILYLGPPSVKGKFLRVPALIRSCIVIATISARIRSAKLVHLRILVLSIQGQVYHISLLSLKLSFIVFRRRDIKSQKPPVWRRPRSRSQLPASRGYIQRWITQRDKRRSWFIASCKILRSWKRTR